MNKIKIAILTIFATGSVYAQTFSFQMYFSDAAGNKDTITLGYDTLATDSIDSVLGEVNIISSPLDSNFDVRISNESLNRRNSRIGTFHTKMQFVNYECFYYYKNVISLDISTKNWPVTAEWDSSLFIDSCMRGSVFTSVFPGGWWDVGSNSNLYRAIMSEKNRVTFTSNINFNFPNSYSSYTSGNDTVAFFWFAFGDYSITYSSINELMELTQNLKVFPVPAKDNVYVSFSDSNMESNVSIVFSDALGRKIYSQKIENTETTIDVNNWQRGVYLYVMEQNGFKTKGGKLIIE